MPHLQKGREGRQKTTNKPFRPFDSLDYTAVCLKPSFIVIETEIQLGGMGLYRH